MKIKFSREITYYPVWGNSDLEQNEQKFHVVITPLELSDILDLMDNLQGFDKDADGMQNIEAIKGVVESCGKLLPKYCKVVDLQDEEGEVTSEHLIKYPFYMGLTMEILSEMASVSMPNEDDEKNLKAQPDTPKTT